MTTEAAVIICGPPPKPEMHTRVSMKRELHDNGFGSCLVIVKGLYGEAKDRVWCSFAAFPKEVWDPTEYPPRTLGWLERRIKTWDAVWPDAEWRVSMVHPWRNETWQRVKPGRWEVTEDGDGFDWR